MCKKNNTSIQIMCKNTYTVLHNLSGWKPCKSFFGDYTENMKKIVGRFGTYLPIQISQPIPPISTQNGRVIFGRQLSNSSYDLFHIFSIFFFNKKNPTKHFCPCIFDTYYFNYRWCAWQIIWIKIHKMFLFHPHENQGGGMEGRNLAWLKIIRTIFTIF